MKTYDETFKSVIERRDAYVLSRKKQMKKAGIAALVLSAAGAVAVLSVFIIKSKLPGTLPVAPPSESIAGSTQTTEPSSSEKEDDEIGKSGGTGDTVLSPPTVKVAAAGEKITDEEAAVYLEENSPSLISSLEASGVKMENVSIMQKGYSHVTWSKDTLEVRENFRDYLLYSGGKLAAIITLVKENGIIYSTPAFGAPWFADYDNFLNKHMGEALLYIYAGDSVELIITPDGNIYSPLGLDCSSYMAGITNPYETFYYPSAVYTP